MTLKSQSQSQSQVLDLMQSVYYHAPAFATLRRSYEAGISLQVVSYFPRL